MAASRASSSFDGVNDYLEFGSETVGPHKDITYPYAFCTWINAGEFPVGNFAIGSITRLAGDPDNFQSLGVVNAATEIYNEPAGVFDTDGPGSNMTVDTWHFLCLNTVAANDRELFLDGVSDITGTDTEDILGLQADMNASQIATLIDGSGTTFEFTGRMAFYQMYNQELSIADQFNIMHNPWSLPGTLIWAPDLLANGAAVGDFIDRSSNGYTPDGGNIPATSTLGPPVHFFLGGM